MYSTLLPELISLAKAAGECILQFDQQSLHVDQKPDCSPVTAADQAASDLIVDGLKYLKASCPVISEEDSSAQAFAKRSRWQQLWLVDPLDGTRGFIEGKAAYTVNIALIEQHQPVLGVVYAPALGELYYAAKGEGAYKLANEEINLTHLNTNKKSFNLLVGRRVDAEALNTVLTVPSTYTQLNSSLKFCRLAEGLADFYPRIRPTSEWDTAAGQCILTEAGGLLVDFQGNPLQYNARETLLNPPFLAMADASRLAEIRPYLIQMEKNDVK